jgi:hypothetical protein
MRPVGGYVVVLFLWWKGAVAVLAHHTGHTYLEYRHTFFLSHDVEHVSGTDWRPSLVVPDGRVGPSAKEEPHHLMMTPMSSEMQGSHALVGPVVQPLSLQVLYEHLDHIQVATTGCRYEGGLVIGIPAGCLCPLA